MEKSLWRLYASKRHLLYSAYSAANIRLLRAAWRARVVYTITSLVMYNLN